MKSALVGEKRNAFHRALPDLFHAVDLTLSKMIRIFFDTLLTFSTNGAILDLILIFMRIYFMLDIY